MEQSAFAGVLTLFLIAAPASAQTPPSAAPETAADGVSVAGVLADSFKLLMIEHGIRVAFQEKTRRELGGPFVRDYLRSVRMPKRWEDTDSWLVNYLGHPIHGAAAGFVWIEHDPRSRREEFGLNGRYWKTRWRPVVASAIFSLQFEIGPLSEASIGNVGLRPETTGWVDYVVTPIGAMAILVGEDALDRFFVRWVEERTTNRTARATLRMLFGPARTLSNLAMGHLPWRRETRTLSWTPR